MVKWPFVAVASISAVAWLATPPGMLPKREPPPDRADAAATKSRLAALARAKVFDLRGSDQAPASRSLPDMVSCRYVNKPVSGTTPKFDCTDDSGAVFRVKYGSMESKGEVATTRLLSSLGFGADDVSMARRVRCYGCPRWPYQTHQVSERLHIDEFFDDRIDYSRYADFDVVSVERRGHGNELEFDDQEGWGFHELSAIDPALGGATREEVDALRLIAVFVNHWDNKASNQSLLCPGQSPCEHPVAMIQDAGSTFGPKKVDLHEWRKSPIWAEGDGCRVTMEHLPYEGGTFEDVQISEAGRRLLATKLLKLGESGARAIFSAAEFEDVEEWVAAFNRRVDAIARHAPCPS